MRRRSPPETAPMMSGTGSPTDSILYVDFRPGISPSLLSHKKSRCKRAGDVVRRRCIWHAVLPYFDQTLFDFCQCFLRKLRDERVAKESLPDGKHLFLGHAVRFQFHDVRELGTWNMFTERNRRSTRGDHLGETLTQLRQ